MPFIDFGLRRHPQTRMPPPSCATVRASASYRVQASTASAIVSASRGSTGRDHGIAKEESTQTSGIGSAGIGYFSSVHHQDFFWKLACCRTPDHYCRLRSASPHEHGPKPRPRAFVFIWFFVGGIAHFVFTNAENAHRAAPHALAARDRVDQLILQLPIPVALLALLALIAWATYPKTAAGPNSV